MIEKLKQKPYGDKVAYKHYANMCVLIFFCTDCPWG